MGYHSIEEIFQSLKIRFLNKARESDNPVVKGLTASWYNFITFIVVYTCFYRLYDCRLRMYCKCSHLRITTLKKKIGWEQEKGWEKERECYFMVLRLKKWENGRFWTFGAPVQFILWPWTSRVSIVILFQYICMQFLSCFNKSAWYGKRNQEVTFIFWR